MSGLPAGIAARQQPAGSPPERRAGGRRRRAATRRRPASGTRKHPCRASAHRHCSSDVLGSPAPRAGTAGRLELRDGARNRRKAPDETDTAEPATRTQLWHPEAAADAGVQQPGGPSGRDCCRHGAQRRREIDPAADVQRTPATCDRQGAGERADIAGVPVGRTAAHVGLLFQHPRDQLFERSAGGAVRLGPGPPGPPAAAARCSGASGRRRPGPRCRRRHPAELPGSHQRLLALATVLARRPAVLALDEPTVGLDGNGLAVLDAAVRSAAEAGAAVVLVTHDVEYARTAAHRTGDASPAGRPARKPAGPTAGTGNPAGIRPRHRRPGPGVRAHRDAGRHTGRQEPLAVDPLGGPHPVQVGRDAAQEHRPARAKDHAEVDVLRPGHHAFGQHQADLLRQGVLGAAQHLFGGGRLVPKAISASVESGIRRVPSAPVPRVP